MTSRSRAQAWRVTEIVLRAERSTVKASAAAPLGTTSPVLLNALPSAVRRLRSSPSDLPTRLCAEGFRVEEPLLTGAAALELKADDAQAGIQRPRDLDHAPFALLGSHVNETDRPALLGRDVERVPTQIVEVQVKASSFATCLRTSSLTERTIER